MRRFFVPPEQIEDARVVLRGSDVNHIRNVLRLREGDRISVLDGQGRQFEVRLTSLGNKEVTGDVVATMAMDTESPVRIVMGQGIIKGNGFDSVVRRAVELGVHQILPVQTKRCVARPKKQEEGKKLERWQRIAEEAAKQSGRSRIPEVGPGIPTLEAFCDQVRDADLKLLFWENETATRVRDVATRSDGNVETIAFLAGPEGGWDPGETDWLTGQGFQSVGLGPRILRAESASLVILSLLQQQWGDL